ncbi:MAG: hypothetical protein E4G94_05015, partial [ANME-2 cluster archaeon]
YKTEFTRAYMRYETNPEEQGGMKLAKQYPHDYRKPDDAETILKKPSRIKEDDIIGFFDETSPQTTSNTQRLWSFTKPTIFKNTTRLRANSFGFYALNGNSVIDFKENSKKEAVCEFLGEIRSINPGNRILIILDNFRSHRTMSITV